MNKANFKQVSYLSSQFIEAVKHFEQIIDLLAHDPYETKDYTVYHGPKETLKKVSFSELKDGQNKENIIQFYLFRIIEHNLSTYLLVSQSNQPASTQQYYLLVVLCTPKILPKWTKQIGMCIKLLVKEINVEGKINNQMIACVSRVQNIVIQTSKRKQSLVLEDVKTKSKDLFMNKKFYDAYILYEIGLASHLPYSASNLRAVLYANSSACLFQMRAYQSSVIYAQIAIKIDRQYPKGYAKKIFALLQLNRFYEIPSLLVNLQMKIHAKQFEKIYKKYTVYLANNIGQFNWHEFFSCNENTRQECVFGEYENEKIQKVKIQGNTIYYAKENIQPFELLLVKKPILFFKYSEIKSEKQVIEEFQRYMILENSFKNAIQNICKKDNGSKENSVQEQTPEHNEKKPRRSIKNIIYRQKRGVHDEGKGLGIWPDLLYFQQKCQPNCSFLTKRNGLLISSTKKIQAGTFLTLDYACMELPKSRQKYLYDNFGIRCECRVCKWEQWPQNLGNIEEVASLIGSIKNLKMLKQLMWSSQEKYSLFLNQKNCNKYDLDILNRFLTIMETNSHWEDIIKLIKLKKQKAHPKIQKQLEKSISSGVSKFLKLTNQESILLIEKLC